MKKLIFLLLLFFSFILVSCAKEKVQLEVPVFIISEDGHINITYKQNTNTYGIVINGQEEKLISIEDEVLLNDGDFIKIRAVSEDEKNYLSSDYSDVQQYIKKVLLNKIEIINSQNGKLEITSEMIPDYESLYVEVNGQVEEMKMSSFLQYNFNFGDVIRVKYKSVDHTKYIENDWSNELVKTLKLPLVNFEINEGKINITSEIMINYDHYALSINGEVEFLNYNDLINKNLEVGDLVQIKYASIDEKVYIENEWSDIVTVTGVFPKLSFTITNGKAKFNSQVLSNYFAIWINVNGSISQCHLKSFIERTFNLGDKVAIKYREVEGCNYTESEWSEVVVAKELLPLLELKLENGKIKIASELFDEYQSVKIEINDKIFEYAIDELSSINFSEGAKIRVKYASPDEELYIENEWSNLIVIGN